MQQEIWKPWKRFLIPGTNQAMYHISDQGRIKSYKNTESYIITNIHPNSGGYLIFQFRLFGKRYSFLVHRLVMEVFVGKPKDGFQVNHINGIKIDNTLENLEYVTHKENIAHAWKIGLSKAKSGKDCHLYNKTGDLHPKSKPIVQLDNEKKLVKKWESANLAAQDLNGNRSHISRAIKTQGKAYGYYWEKI